MAAIALEHVAKHWGATRAVDDVSFDVAAGTFAVLLGPSGCGKSTTLRLIAGLETVTAGRVRIGGVDVTLGNSLWHDRRVIALLDVARQLLGDLLRFGIVALRPTLMVAAENLFLRRQLAMYVERDVRPRRPDGATRVSLTRLSRLFDWRTSLVVVRPETLIRWHRAGFRLLWRLK